jgi:hypothetical protein
MTDLARDPHLLIKTHKDPEDLKKRIVSNRVRPLASTLPICRFRGTAVYPNGTIVGWQRNISRLRKMDVSFPTIITLTLGPDHTIADIDLDPGFKGSKGLMCSHPYLNRNMKRHLVGARLDATLFCKLKQRRLHCFHLVEVLLGVATFYQIYLNRNQPDKLYYEQEVSDSYSSGNDLVAQGKQDLNGETTVRYTIHYVDLLKRIAFDESGALSKLEDLEMTFFLNGASVMTQVVNLNDRFKKMLEFMLACIDQVKGEICPDLEIPFKNTNLLPSAILSMLTQASAMHLFNNNYAYVMHVLSALQRRNNVPACVGAIKDEAEAQQYFPDYRFGEII